MSWGAYPQGSLRKIPCANTAQLLCQHAPLKPTPPKMSGFMHHFLPHLLSLLPAFGGGWRGRQTLQTSHPTPRGIDGPSATPRHCATSRPGDLPLEQRHQFTHTFPPSALWILTPYLIFRESKGLCVPPAPAQSACLSPGSPQTTRLFPQHEVSQGPHAILAQARVLPRHSRNSTGKEQYLLFRASEGPSLPFQAG